MGKYLPIIVIVAIGLVGIFEYDRLSLGRFDPRELVRTSPEKGSVVSPPGTLCSEIGDEYRAAATAKRAYELELDLMRQGLYCYDLPIFDAEWRQRGAKLVADKKYAETWRRFDEPYKVAESGDHAVVYYPDRLDLGPAFLRREYNGWVLDRTATSRYIHYDLSDTAWYADEGQYAYLTLLLRALSMKQVVLLDGRKTYHVIR